MEKIKNSLKGKKTYIVGFLLAVLAFAQHVGFVGPEMAETFQVLLLGGGITALRAGMN